jgi:hypothetical protein
MPGVFLLSPGPVFADPNKQVIHANATISSDGYMILSGYGVSEVTLFINVLNSPTGVTPGIQFTMQEVDPGNEITVVGSSISSSVITGISIQKISLIYAFGGSIKISWAITGTGGPTFTGVYSTLVGKAGTISLVDKSGNAIDSSNPMNTQMPAVSNSVVTSVPSSASNSTLLVANANRKGAVVYNNSISPLFIKFGATASVSDFTVSIAAGGYFEFPLPIYSGIVDCIWSVANGAAKVTETS